MIAEQTENLCSTDAIEPQWRQRLITRLIGRQSGTNIDVIGNLQPGQLIADQVVRPAIRNYSRMHQLSVNYPGSYQCEPNPKQHNERRF